MSNKYDYLTETSKPIAFVNTREDPRKLKFSVDRNLIGVSTYIYVEAYILDPPRLGLFKH